MKNLNYGIIGNCKSAALISEKGSIDWCCLPDFNSSSVFAKLLDENIGGSFEIHVDESYQTKQFYVKSTSILCTRFSNGIDIFEIFDFMPRYQKLDNGGYYNPPDIIRYFKYVSGKPCFSIYYNPKLEYALPETKSLVKPSYIKSYTTSGEYDSLYFYTSFDKEKVVKHEQLTLESDAFILLSYNQKLLEQTVERQYLKLQRTKVYWLNWSDQVKSYPTYRDEIVRSALV